MRMVTMRSSSPHSTVAPVVAVNDTVIAHAAIAREVQHHTGGTPRAAWQEATRALVIRELLLQRTHALGVLAQPQSQDGLRETQDEALIRALLETEVRAPMADDAACLRYYQANLAKFRSPDLFEPLHILFKAARVDAEAYMRARTQANATLAALRDSPGQFETVARSVSECSSAHQGGRLGQVASGETTPEFEAAMRALQPGEISPIPVETRYGVHIIRLDRKIAGEMLPFPHVRDRIAAWLEESSWRRAVAQYVRLLAGHARVTGCDINGANSPLVQ
jgi:peptidyl-prolyl cis-trans isomerase C